MFLARAKDTILTLRRVSLNLEVKLNGLKFPRKNLSKVTTYLHIPKQVPNWSLHSRQFRESLWARCREIQPQPKRPINLRNRIIWVLEEEEESVLTLYKIETILKFHFRANSVVLTFQTRLIMYSREGKEVVWLTVNNYLYLSLVETKIVADLVALQIRQDFKLRELRNFLLLNAKRSLLRNKVAKMISIVQTRLWYKSFQSHKLPYILQCPQQIRFWRHRGKFTSNKFKQEKTFLLPLNFKLR